MSASGTPLSRTNALLRSAGRTEEEISRRNSGGARAAIGPVRAALAGAPGVRSALLVGDRVHLFVDEASRRLPDLRGRLESAGIVYDSIQPVAPTIEDLFVSAVESEPAASAQTKPL